MKKEIRNKKEQKKKEQQEKKLEQKKEKSLLPTVLDINRRH